jgi:hypothetical protein
MLKKSLRDAEQDRADIAEARQDWRAIQPHLNQQHLVFIDETGAKTNMVRLYGRVPVADAFSRLCRMAIGYRQHSLPPFVTMRSR